MTEVSAGLAESPLPAAHSRAPLRLGLAGGGTDVSPYCDQFGGRVLNATISLFAHCHLSLLDRNVCEFVASNSNEKVCVAADCVNTSVGPLQLHRAVHVVMVNKYLGAKPQSVRLVTYSDAPPGSGVGSSSAIVVAMVKAYSELFGLNLSKSDIARHAFEIERIECALAGGKQDHYAAAFGGFNFMEFEANDRVSVNRLHIPTDVINRLQSHLLLYFTGRSRLSSTIIESQIAATYNHDHESVAAMHSLRSAAVKMRVALEEGRVSQVVDILERSWHAKKKLAIGVTNDSIEEVSRLASAAGAQALKISGAGGGGFMMIAVPPTKQQDVKRALSSSGGTFFCFTFIDQGVESWKCEDASSTTLSLTL